MENITTESISPEAAQVIAETKACGAALSTMIHRQNEVVLSYCRTLIDHTLEAMSTLRSIEQSGSASSTSQNMEQWQSQLLQAIKDSTEALKNSIPIDVNTPSAKLADNTDIAIPQPLQSFVSSSANLFANAVASQQQFNVITQAATAQTLCVILNAAAANTIKQAY